MEAKIKTSYGFEGDIIMPNQMETSFTTCGIYSKPDTAVEQVANECIDAANCEIAPEVEHPPTNGADHRVDPVITVAQALVAGNESFRTFIDNLLPVENEPIHGDAAVAADSSNPFHCSVCHKQLANKHALHRHMTTHTPKSYKCEKCDLTFTSRALRTQHTLTHAGERPYKCTECSSSFKQRGSLRNHQLIHSGVRAFQCDQCESRFVRKAHLQQHLVSHTGVKAFTCHLCNRSFTLKDNLKKHYFSHTGARPYKCEECGANFVQKSTLNYHKLTHSGEKPFKCDKCSRRFTRKSDLKQHVLAQSCIKASFACDKCDCAFSTKRARDRHQTDRHHMETDLATFGYEEDIDKLNHVETGLTTSYGHGEEMVKPNQTRTNLVMSAAEEDIVKPNQTETGLMISVKEEDVVKPNHDYVSNGPCEIDIKLDTVAEQSANECIDTANCEIPPGVEHPPTSGADHRVDPVITVAQALVAGIDSFRTFIDNLLPVANELIHGDAAVAADSSKPFQCSVCYKQLANKHALHRHMTTHTPKSYKCEKCDLTFTSRALRTQHTLTHAGERPYKCTECSSLFKQRGSLRNHQLIHSGVRAFQCDQCESRFVRKAHLQQHLVSHTGVKAFTCHLCNHSFTLKHALKKHYSSHTGARPHKCVECGASFIQKSALNYHKLTHSGKKPFKCDECSRCFTRKFHLKEHVLAHYGIKASYACNKCDRVFTAKRARDRHQVTPHFSDAASKIK